MSCPGESVGLEFQSADATTAAAITLKDANNVTRTLLSSERLLIDTVSMTLAAAVLQAELINDTDADGNVDAGERIASFGPNCGNFVAGEEGVSCNAGTTPKVKAAQAGIVILNGSGRIVNALGRTTRPTWLPIGH